jgi:hypothetical protein
VAISGSIAPTLKRSEASEVGECPVPPVLGEMLEGDMSERRITQLFGLILGGIFACTLVLSAFAF